MKCICYLCFLLFFFCANTMQEIQNFDHSSLLSNKVVRETYEQLGNAKNKELLSKFKECCLNRGAIDDSINAALEQVVKNSAGRETLRLITSRVYPFAKCAYTLEQLVDSIPVEAMKKPEDMINKAKKITLLFDTLGVQSKDPLDALIDISDSMNVLRSTPVEFSDKKYIKGSLLRVFNVDSMEMEIEKEVKIICTLNQVWQELEKREVKEFAKGLKEGMFYLEMGRETQYVYDRSKRHGVIYFSKKKIRARCITGPRLCTMVGATPIYKCYRLRKNTIGSPSGLHHELFHHLVIGLESNVFPSFGRLAAFLNSRKVDPLYLVVLETVYTDMDELRNIIGIFVDDQGKVWFDTCSEAAYLTAECQSIRGTHKSNTANIRYIPISFVELVKEANPKMKLNESAEENYDTISWV